MSQKFRIDNFEGIKDASQYNEDFIKNYNEESDEDIFLKLTVNILKNYTNFIMI